MPRLHAHQGRADHWLKGPPEVIWPCVACGQTSIFSLKCISPFWQPSHSQHPHLSSYCTFLTHQQVVLNFVEGWCKGCHLWGKFSLRSAQALLITRTTVPQLTAGSPSLASPPWYGWWCVEYVQLNDTRHKVGDYVSLRKRRRNGSGEENINLLRDTCSF